MPAKKAPADGEYVLDGNHYLIRKGDIMPDGAEFSSDRDEPQSDDEVVAEEPAKAEKAVNAAPENKAK